MSVGLHQQNMREYITIQVQREGSKGARTLSNNGVYNASVAQIYALYF